MSIKAMRANANLSQEAVAKELGITVVSYRRKEQGKREFKFSELLKMCKLFNVELNDFADCFILNAN